MPTPPTGTFSLQHKLPRLPVPPLEDTLKRYLRSLRALQDDTEHDKTKAAVEQFLSEEGPRIQEKLVEYAKDKDRYVVWVLRGLALTVIYATATSKSSGTSFHILNRFNLIYG